MGKQFRVTVPNAEFDNLMDYCKKTGATRSAVVTILISNYLDDFKKDVKFAIEDESITDVVDEDEDEEDVDSEDEDEDEEDVDSEDEDEDGEEED